MEKDKEGKRCAVVKTTEYCSGELDSHVAAVKFPGDTMSINHLNKSFHKCSDVAYAGKLQRSGFMGIPAAATSLLSGGSPCSLVHTMSMYQITGRIPFTSSDHTSFLKCLLALRAKQTALQSCYGILWLHETSSQDKLALTSTSTKCRDKQMNVIEMVENCFTSGEYRKIK